MKKIINNRDLDNIHIDTYQCFNMEYETEREIEYYNEEHGSDFDYDDLEIEYDMEGYREALSKASIEFILDRLDDDPIIKGIRYISSKSPRFYNYTTDSYDAEYTYDPKKLIEWIGKNEEGWREYIKNWDSIEYNSKIYLNSLDFKKGEIDINDPLWNEDLKKYQANIITIPIEDEDDIIISMISYYIREELGDISEEYIWELMENAYASEYIDIKGVEKNEEEAV